jgi:hypothetical protein
MRPLWALSLGAAFAMTGCIFSDDDDDGNDNSDACVTKCDDTHSSCTADCNDDACIAVCDTDRDDCETDCD